MKLVLKGFIALLFVFVSTSTFAQSYPIDKGSKMIAGSFSITSAGGDLYTNSEEGRATTILLNGSYGYFVTKGVNIGGKILFSRYSHGDVSNTGWGIGPSFSYYFGDEKSKVYPYLAASFFYDKYVYSTNDGILGKEVEYSQSRITTHLAGGVCYMLSSAIGLFSELNYEIENYEFEKDKINGNTINFMVGINAFLY